jgi:ubiquinone/menaquinone biosynthesis C-methylase UbiE
MRKSMGDASEQKTRRYYDDFSDSYERGRGYGYHRMIDDLEVQVTTPYARGARALELGCGTGLILARVAEVAREAVGVDLSEGMAQRARDRGLDVHIGSVCDLPFEDEQFDLTYSFKVLAHVPDIVAAVREAARVGDDRTEADIPTRWDSPRDIPKLLPPNVELVDYHGVRVLTPFAAEVMVETASIPTAAP